MKLTGNTIFITGGGSGIGRGLAEALHKLGNKVIVSGRRAERLAEVVQANPGIEAIELDIADPLSIEKAAHTLIERYPDLNMVFNNAGVMMPDNAAGTITEDVLFSTIDTNLVGPIRLTSALVEHLKTKDDAAIIYTSSVLAFMPLAFTAVYSATKAAIHSYALSQRFALRDTSVKVIEIAPPWVRTELMNSQEVEVAMPLQAFIDETIALLGKGDEEVVVNVARRQRNNAGPSEHAQVTAMNADLFGFLAAA